MRRYWYALRDWWHRQQGRDRVEMALEAAIFFATLTYVIVASRQLSVMRETLRQQGNMIEQNKDLITAAKRQAEAAVTTAQAAESQAHAMIATLPMMRTQANAALKAAQAAKIQAASGKAQVEAMAEGNKNAINSLHVAQAALEETQKSFQIDQRPYLVVEQRPLFTGPIVKNKPPPEVNITYKNIGRTPATKVRLYLAMVRFNPSSAIERFATFSEDAFAKLRRRSEMYGTYERLIRQDEAPNVSTFSTATDTNPTPLSAQDLDDLSTGALGFFVIGLFQYSDAFNGSYETQFCSYFFGGNQTDRPWHICASHNTIQ